MKTGTSHSAYSRRELLRTSGLLAPGLLGPAVAAAQREVSGPLTPLNRFPRMVHEYYVDWMRRIQRKRLAALDSLKTRSHAEAYVHSVRERVRTAFGPLPEKTPLAPRVTGVVERDTYKIEKIVFESRPGFLVSANLYVPKGRKFPLPGVVGSCGHSDNGKAIPVYQSFTQGLARLGYVVLVFDPIGQGERMQYVDAEYKPRRGTGTREHLYAGNQQFLVDEFFGTWRAWDGIRALDYLLTREEVDPRHIGITGNSGGGTMTTWLCGLEPRWTMAAPSCFVLTFTRNMENELPADTEQCPPRALALGLDHEDFLAAMAPKPVIILAKEGDFFDVRGTEEAYLRLKRLYGMLGAPDNIAMHISPGYHGYSKESREAMYRWFDKATGQAGARDEPDLTIEKDETIWCAPRGQVAALNSRPIYAFTADKSRQLARERVKFQDAGLERVVADVLQLPERTSAPYYRILRPRNDRAYPLPHAAVYLVETEPGIQAVVYRLSKEQLISRPPRGIPRAILYVPHRSSDLELREEPLVKELMQAEPEAAFYACDPRGTGESQPDTTNANSFLEIYGSDYFYSIHGIMLDRPYAGQKTHDLLSAIDWLNGIGHTEIHLAAKGWGAIPATFAAVLSEHVTQVTLKHALASYSEIAESEAYAWPLSCLVPGVLKYFDMPDCYRHLERKNLRQIEPWQVSPKWS